jgi:hypothetical protein
MIFRIRPQNPALRKKLAPHELNEMRPPAALPHAGGIYFSAAASFGALSGLQLLGLQSCPGQGDSCTTGISSSIRKISRIRTRLV